MELKTRILKNQYHDSVALMLAAKQLKSRTDVADAAFIMGTDVNKDLLAQGGLLTKEGQSAQPNDLIITVKCRSNADQVLNEALGLLTKKVQGNSAGESLPKTVRSAIRSHPDLNLAVISVAGTFAAREAREALAAGLHVLLFSDNVSIGDEIALKKLANEKRLLLMGPGAGTAIINGVGLGFANAVPRGNIGIVSAAGTGLQEVSSLIAKKGGGVSQGIGTGGRDLSQEVGGLMFFSAIDALQSDPETEVIVLISKPPADEIASQLLAKIGSPEKKFEICLLGAGLPEEKTENLFFTRTLEECATTAVALAKGGEQEIYKLINQEDEQTNLFIRRWKGKLAERQRFIRGLYSGGTLCYEAQVILKDMLDTFVYSNAPLDKNKWLKDSTRSIEHTLIDLGEEEFTRGRPHPMIDNDLRIQRLRQEVLDPETGVILLDVVIGYGAHPDPTSELGEAIREVSFGLEKKGKPIAFVASITGTESDPQKLSRSQEILKKAGVMVCESNAQAARLAAALVERR